MGADSISLAPGDVNLQNTGTANGTVTVSGTGTSSRTVTLSSITGNGAFRISIKAGTAIDSAGNVAAEAGPSATFTVDNETPTAARWYADGQIEASGDGKSWSAPFKTLQEAVDAAKGGDEVWVKASSFALTTPVELDKAVAIYGGFAGNETERNQRNWKTYVTTLDGQETSQCLTVSAGATIDGFTITRGQGIIGGGVLVSNGTVASPTVSS